ncbi:MAG: gamma-glutamyl-gamma-aminobutyrate hydrolase [Alphaproteobacteria bacterium]|nr:gamma-glutamyl-gamma-aminobutyrate hydrolase [Alphaproteobacteria bacterium]
MANVPLIGFTLDYETGAPTGQYSKFPWYAIRDNYTASVAEQGAAPIALPHEISAVPRYLELLDGLVITGGNFDVPPEMYGETVTSDRVETKPRRTQFEWAITEGCIARGIPILGICGGEQLLNVILGGTLIQHIPDTIADALAHEQPNPRTEPGHDVTLVTGTQLHRILGVSQLPVNSAHHQAIATPAPQVVVNATAPDGVIEGIELPTHPFCIGVQWHPEYHVTSHDTSIFTAFVAACKTYREQKDG